MFNAQNVLLLYKAIASLFSFQAVMFHILFGSVLWVVFGGNRKPGWTLLSLTFTSMAFSVLYAAGTKGLSLTVIAFLVLFFCAAYDVVQPLTHWGNGKDRPLWTRRLAYLGLAWAWLYPHHVSLWTCWIASPLGVLPSPTLLALLSLLWLAYPQTNRLLHWAAAILGLLYGLFGVLVLHVYSDLLLLAVAGVSLWDLKRAIQEAGGVLEEDLTPEERPKKASEQTKKDQVWRI